MGRAFLLIENHDHPAVDERRVATEWMPLAQAVAWRARLLERAFQRGLFVEVTIQHDVDCRGARNA